MTSAYVTISGINILLSTLEFLNFYTRNRILQPEKEIISIVFNTANIIVIRDPLRYQVEQFFQYPVCENGLSIKQNNS
jgi:hypothetical protein